MPGTPRVLTIGFKIHVNPELRANIRFVRIEQAAEALINGVLTLVPRVFPWAERIEVTRGWSYDWWDPETEMIPLPRTTENTPGTAATTSMIEPPDDLPAA